MKTRLQIDIDDTKGFFKYLAAHPETESIFDTIALGFLLKLHQQYGTEFTLLCLYGSKGFTLDQVSERYREEFQMNKDWLHFGFHGFQEDSDYTDATAGQLLEEYEKTMGAVRRITGIEEFADTVCLHGFTGNRDVCRALRSQGIRSLLTADDERKSYYLTDAECRRVKAEGRYWDKPEELWFVPRLTRLEHGENPVGELQKALEAEMPLVDVFTHEWLLDKQAVRDRLQACCEWAYLSGFYGGMEREGYHGRTWSEE